MSLDTSRLGGPWTTVVDVGAFTGGFALACFEAWPLCTVHSFEPLLEVTNRFNRWHWYRAAVGSQAGTALMHRCEFIPSSSLLEMADLHKDAFPYTRRHQVERVAVVRLDSFPEVVNAPALLKVDVQGYELEVLKGAGDLLRRFRAVVLEVSHQELYRGAPTFDDLNTFLDDAGFRHSHRVDELRDPRTDELLQSDEFWAAW